MQSALLLWALLVAHVQSICTGALYWDPFDNACVSRTYLLTQNAPGNLLSSTTRTLLPTSAFRPAPLLLVFTPTTSPNPAFQVLYLRFSLSLGCHL